MICPAPARLSCSTQDTASIQRATRPHTPAWEPVTALQAGGRWSGGWRLWKPRASPPSSTPTRGWAMDSVWGREPWPRGGSRMRRPFGKASLSLPVQKPIAAFPWTTYSIAERMATFTITCISRRAMTAASLTPCSLRSPAMKGCTSRGLPPISRRNPSALRPRSITRK